MFCPEGYKVHSCRIIILQWYTSKFWVTLKPWWRTSNSCAWLMLYRRLITQHMSLFIYWQNDPVVGDPISFISNFLSRCRGVPIFSLKKPPAKTQLAQHIMLRYVKSSEFVLISFKHHLQIKNCKWMFPKMGWYPILILVCSIISHQIYPGGVVPSVVSTLGTTRCRTGPQRAGRMRPGRQKESASFWEGNHQWFRTGID